MYYFVDMYNNKLNFIENISDEDCLKAFQASEQTKVIVEFYSLGLCVCDALDKLVDWSNNAQKGGNYIRRNLHTAERLSRGFLFEFRTCLDHMETEIKKSYGKDSELLQIFKSGTNSVYDTVPEYAFTFHLRNYCQHCKNIVHGFNGNVGIKMSSNVSILLNEYENWKDVDEKFMASAGENIDLISLFTKAFEGLNTAVSPTMQYLLDHDNACKNLLYLRQWGDSLTEAFKHSVKSFHIMEVVFSDGSKATREDMSAEGVSLNAYTIDWDMVYALTDSLTKRRN